MQIRDLMEMSHEIYQKERKNPMKQHELFIENFFEELKKNKVQDIVQYFNCTFDVLNRCYKVVLKFPITICKSDSADSDVK